MYVGDNASVTFDSSFFTFKQKIKTFISLLRASSVSSSLSTFNWGNIADGDFVCLELGTYICHVF
jgi:hypothetical protein